MARVAAVASSGLRLFANGVFLVATVLVLYPIFRLFTQSARPRIRTTPEGFDDPQEIEPSDEQHAPSVLSTSVHRSRWSRRVVLLLVLALLVPLLSFGLMISPAFAGHCNIGASLDPSTDSNPAGTTHTVTATVFETAGGDVQGSTVTFTATGPAGQVFGATQTITTTGTSAAVTFSFQSTLTGITQITATAECDGHLAPGSSTGSKTWTSATPTTITLEPLTDTNTVNTTHTVTATVTDTFGNRDTGGTAVTFTVAGTGAETPSSGTEVTNENGQAIISFTSTKTGTSTLEAGITVTVATATKNWTPSAVQTVTVFPATDSNVVGTNHTVTTSVTDQFGNPVPNTPVNFTASGTGAENPSTFNTTTDANGVSTYTFGSTRVGTSTVTATAGGKSGNATKGWTNSTPTTVTVEPPTDENVVGTTHTVTATVVDAFGNPVTETTVDFTMAGTGDETALSPASVLTDGSGQATFSFTSTIIGTSTVTATAADTGKSGNATKRWISAAAATVTVTPTSDSNVVGTNHTITATVKDDFGNPVAGAVVTFTATGTGTESPPTGSATTDQNGNALFTFTASTVGTSTITANSGAFSATATKTWTAGQARQVTLDPQTDSNTVGTTHLITATVRDQFGNQVAEGGHTIAWTVTGTGVESPDQEVDTTNASGQATFTFTSTKTGTSFINALAFFTTGGRDDDTATKNWTAGAPNSVTLVPTTDTNPPNTTHTVTATVKDSFGNLVPGAVVTFTAAGTGAETPSSATRTTNANGEATFDFTSTQTGTSTITASVTGVSPATATKTWAIGPPASVTIDPPSDTNTVGTTHTVTATVTDTGGNPVSGTVVTFSVAGTGAETPTGATKTTNASGQATFDFNSTKTGTSNITATSGGASGNATKVWTAAAAATLTLDPPTDTNTVGTTHTVTATVKDGFGNNVEDGTTVSFTVAGTGGETPTSGSANTVNGQATFQFTSTRTGTSSITATSGAAVGTAEKTWIGRPPATIDLSPADDTNTIDAAHVVTAIVRDADGNVVEGQLLVGDKHECLDETCTSIGPFTEAQTRTTDVNGQATFTFNSSQVGRFVIHVYADNDPTDGTPPPEAEDTPRAEAFKTWICGPFNGPYFPNVDIARDIALLPGEDCAGYLLDGYGARHPFGGAPATNGGPYFPGFDIARAIVINPAGTGGFVLDGFGARHPFGIGANSPPPTPTDGPYFAGFDIANDLILTGATKGYVLDGFGARHPWGGAPATTGGPYFPGYDIARAFDMFPAADGSPGLVLDGLGGRHPFNGAAAQTGGPYFPGFDIARDIVMTGAGQGYVLDGFGARHPFGGQAPTVGGPYFPGFDISRGFAISGHSGILLEGFGGLHVFRVP